MLWFQPFPWGRWALVLLVAGVAGYLEVRPDPSVDQPFATRNIAVGELITDENTDMRRIPAGLLEGAALGEVAARPVAAEAPVLASDVAAAGSEVPAGWWIVSVALPERAHAGDDVRLVLLDSGTEVRGVVAHEGSDDPFAAADGAVAVPSDRSTEVAIAASAGRVAVLVATG